MFDFLKRKSRIVDVKVEGDRGTIQKKNQWLIAIVAVAVCILVFGSFGDRDDGEKRAEPEEAAEELTEDTYVRETEERLAAILSEIKGAGQVKVMVTFDGLGEKVLAKNKSDTLETSMTDQGSESHSSGEESILLYGSGEREAPYVVKERLPVPAGVFVTATGAASENVRLEIYEAVKALYGISGHRIKVSASEM